MLLNFGVFDAPVDEVVKQLLRAAGATPAIAVTRPTGEEIPGLEVSRWYQGDIELVALYGTAEGEARVQLPAERFVYELKTGHDFGEVGEFAIDLRPHRASFFALLPAAAPAPEISLDTKKARRGQEVRIGVSVPGAAGKHAVRLVLTAPDGERAEWFERKLVVATEAEEVVLPFAHNDPKGDWRIDAIDLFTSRATTAKLKLK